MLTYALISVLICSLISLIGIFTLGIKNERLKKVLILFVSFSAGALLGDVFFHILPEVNFSLNFSLFLLSGIVLFFLLEKIICWKHCHLPITKEHKHPFTYMVLFGDSLHNFIDGLIIFASYAISFPVGLATTIAVFLHEIPQEIGDFAILLHGGFSKKKALFLNFVSSLTAVLGVFVAFLFSSFNLVNFLLGIAAGGFIYIALTDLIPEMHKETRIKESLLQILFFILGILVMLGLRVVG